MIKKIIFNLVLFTRNEKIQIGDFSSMDLLLIFKLRIISFLRGFFFFNILKVQKGIFFVGKNVSLLSRNKIIFSSGTTLGDYVKISAIGSKSFKFGSNFTVKDFCIIDSLGSLKRESGNLIVGNNVGISENCYLSVKGNLTIGNNVIFGPNVKVFTENHRTELSNLPFRLQDEIRKDVIIGNNVWIGSGVIILAGVTIFNNSVIAAGSVVTKDVESGCIFAGIPAKRIKKF